MLYICVSFWLFNFFSTKVSHFVSNLNDDFHEASFGVYYVSISQKLVILGFSPQIFFILTSFTSETSWGQTMSFSDLTEVSNLTWICHFSYEVLFVELGWKLKHPEIAISPASYNWPKSPHHLGLIWLDFIGFFLLFLLQSHFLLCFFYCLA